MHRCVMQSSESVSRRQYSKISQRPVSKHRVSQQPKYFTKQTKKVAPSKCLGRTNMSVVPPNFRKILRSLQYGNQNCNSDIASPDNGGNLRWSLLGIICSIQSSKATSILPSRKFSPATFSLFIRNSMYSSSSMLFVCNCYRRL